MKTASDNLIENKINNNDFFTIEELSCYLRIKTKTLYSWAENGSIPHYKIGRLIRFKKSDIDSWMGAHRKEYDSCEVERGAENALKSARKGKCIDPHRLAKKIIDEVKVGKYTPRHGKSDQIKGLGKEVNDGII